MIDLRSAMASMFRMESNADGKARFPVGVWLWDQLVGDPGGDATKTLMGDGSWTVGGGVTLASLGITATAAEVNYTTDVTSNIQAQIDAKLDDSQATAFGLSLLDDADAAAGRTTLALGNVDNTSDAAKPVSTATQTAIDAKVSDTVYGAGWNAVTTVAPSKNAVYDKVESLIHPFLLMGA